MGPDEPTPTVLGRPILTVSELNEQVKGCLERAFGVVAVAGEIADLAFPRSGHVYFALRDPKAQVAAVLWRGVAGRLPFRLEEGLGVIAVGRLSLYGPRGTYQLVVSEVVPRGLGDLRRGLEELRRRLAAEGLFDDARKRPLPPVPRAIAVITSPSGAAVHDIIRTALARFPRLTIRIVPVRVQGAEAPREIVQAIAAANTPGVADVILLGRGGGGMDDLWAFNDESVVRAVAGSRVPVVSCVGHETDVTLSDCAADVRASTPTQAAALAVPVLVDLIERLGGAADRAERAARRAIERRAARLALLAARPALAEPERRLREVGQYLDDMADRMDRGLCTVARRSYNLLALCAARLATLNPLAALRRGFTVTTFEDGRLVRSVNAARPGMRLNVRFWDGCLGVSAREVREETLGSQATRAEVPRRPGAARGDRPPP
jgi:exodeoxyribonuclease VII large subunit